MKPNIGAIDRIIRVLIGVLLCASADNGHLGLWAWIGVLPIITALLNFCPIYSLIGCSTNKPAKK